MFKVIYKKSKEHYRSLLIKASEMGIPEDYIRHALGIEIYGVKDDKHGYPTFLIRSDNRWIWKSAKHFIPVEEI